MILWFLVAGCDRAPGASDGQDDVVDTGPREFTTDTAPVGTPPGPSCPSPAWSRVIGGAGDDHIATLSATYDGAYVALGTSGPTPTFDVGDGPFAVDWTWVSAWVAVLEHDDGALRWLVPIVRQETGADGTRLDAIASPHDSGVVAAGQLLADGLLAPGSPRERAASAGTGFVVRLNSEGLFTAVLPIEPDTANGAELTALTVAAAGTGDVLLEGSGHGVVRFDGFTVDLEPESGWFVAGLAPDLSVQWAWTVDNATVGPAVAMLGPGLPGDVTWVATGTVVDDSIPAVLPDDVIHSTGFAVQIGSAGDAMAGVEIGGIPSALGSSYLAGTNAVSFDAAGEDDAMVDLAHVVFSKIIPVPVFPVPLLTHGPLTPLADVSAWGVAVGGFADLIEAPVADGEPLVVELPEPAHTTTLFTAPEAPVCVVVTDATDAARPELDDAGDMALAGSFSGVATIDRDGPAPASVLSRSGQDGFVALLATPSAY